MKYLSLIQAIVLLDGKERPKQKGKNNNCDIQQFEAMSENIGLANRLAHKMLGRKLQNLSPLSLLLLLLIEEMVGKICATQQIKYSECRFTYENIQGYTGWKRSQLMLHLHTLKRKRYIHQDRNVSLPVYELLFDGRKMRVEYFLMKPMSLSAK